LESDVEGRFGAVEGLQNEPIAVAHDAAIEKLFAKNGARLDAAASAGEALAAALLQVMRTLVSPKRSP
jgi:hypothetical protein